MNNETKKEFTEFKDAFKKLHKEMYSMIDLGSCGMTMITAFKGYKGVMYTGAAFDFAECEEHDIIEVLDQLASYAVKKEVSCTAERNRPGWATGNGIYGSYEEIAEQTDEDYVIYDVGIFNVIFALKKFAQTLGKEEKSDLFAVNIYYDSQENYLDIQVMRSIDQVEQYRVNCFGE